MKICRKKKKDQPFGTKEKFEQYPLRGVQIYCFVPIPFEFYKFLIKNEINVFRTLFFVG